MQHFLELGDTFLIFFFRLTGNAMVDFLIGTFLLALTAVILGEITISLVFLVNRGYIDHVNQEVVRYRDLSMEALSVGRRDAYKAANKMANDAFGKSYFLQLALAGASLWPAALALAWMNTRFAEVEFPFAWTSFHVGYVTPFILLYIVARILFKAVKPHIPYFRYINSILDTYKDKPASDTARESPTSTSREK